VKQPPTSDQLIAIASTLDESAFTKKHPGIYIVLRGQGERLPDSGVGTTVRMEPQRLSEKAPRETGKFKVIPVVPRGATPFSDMVSIGRTEENDVVLPNTTVSKLHAYFSEVEGGAWTLTDKGSTNGTAVNGMRLKPDEPYRLGGSDAVSFGHCHVMVKSSAALWRFLDHHRRSA
jgi:hypothetical protein